MNCCGEEERGDNAPKPLCGRQPATTKCRGAGRSRCARRTSSACPPEKKPQEYRFGERSERHAKVQKQQRPHIDSEHLGTPLWFPVSQTNIVVVLRPFGFTRAAQKPKPGVSRAAPNSALSIPTPGLPPRL